ncbi:hypothetical protein BDV19DRAFT_388831 [Aspergillus venezuelensis]
MVSSLLSNALMPLTRLNVKHGLKRLYENAWGARNRTHYSEPALTEVDFTVDVYRAVYIPEKRTLFFDLALYKTDVKGSVAIDRVFGRGNWTLNCDGDEVARGTSHSFSPTEKSLAIKQDTPKVASRLGWAFSFQGNTPSGIMKDCETLRVPLTGTKVASYELVWE